MVEEHLVSNGSVQKLEERLVVVRHRDLQERDEGLDGSNLGIRSTGQSKDMEPTCTHVVALAWERYEASQIDILHCLILLSQYGLAPLKQQGSKEEAQQITK